MKDNVIIKAEDFRPEEHERYHLCIELNENGYNYAVIDNYAELKVLGSSAKDFFEDDHSFFQETSFKSVKISILTKNFTFIPEVHYAASLDKQFGAFIDWDENTENLQTSLLNKIDIRNVYTIKKDNFSAIKNIFEKSLIFPQANVFYNGCIKLAETKQELFLNFKEEHVEVLLLKNAELFFYNIFNINNTEELQYFIRLTLQQKNIDAANISVKISGEIDEQALAYKVISAIFPAVSFMNPEFLVKAGEDFTDLKLHQYFSLLSLPSCE